MTALIDAMAATPEATLGELPRLPAQDLLTLRAFNDTHAPIPEPLCVHEIIEAQVDRTPNARPSSSAASPDLPRA